MYAEENRSGKELRRMSMEAVKEVNGSRKFERVSRWNVLNYTIISDHNRFAKYADNAGNKNEKLTLTYFKLRNQHYPLNKYGKLATPIQLEDHSILSRQDVEDGIFYLEINATKDKVRLYREITQ